MAFLPIDNRQALEFDNLIEKKFSEYFSWKNSRHDCMFNGCKKHAINSHAISEKASLSIIGEDGEVCCVKSKRNGFVKEIEIGKISVGRATTFKGFCSEHDHIFEPLDKGAPETDEDIYLQVYRSVCYLLCRANFFNKTEKYYIDFAEQQLIGRLNVPNEYDDKVRELVKNQYSQIYKRNLCFESNLLKEYKNSMQKKISGMNLKKEQNILPDDNSITVLYKKLDFIIPIAMLNQHIVGTNKEKSLFLFLVIPYEACTVIYWVFEKMFFDFFVNRWRCMFEKDINILIAIESSMMSCDNWYIKPSVIASWSVEKKEIITNDLYFINEFSPFKEYDLSIFDDLRVQLIKNEDTFIQEIESKKIKNIPLRNSKKERTQRLNETLAQSIV